MSYVKTLYYDATTTYSLNGAQYSPKLIYSGLRTGDRVPGWRKLIKEGRQASSDYSVDIYSIKGSKAGSCTGLYSVPGPTSSVVLSKSFSGIPAINQGFNALPPFPENVALAKCYNKARELRSHMNGLNTLGELRETVHMIRNPAQALVKNINKWADDVHRRTRPSKFSRPITRKRYADIASGTWLEAQFGWRPLISDIKGMAETVARIHLNLQNRQDRVVSYGRNESVPTLEYFPVDEPNVPDTAPRISIFNWDRRRKAEASTRYELFLSSSLQGPVSTFERVAQVSGFTFENVVPTIYELTPYSFLIDYISNLGECINALFTDRTGMLHALRTNRTLQETTISSGASSQYWRDQVISEGLIYRGYSGTSGQMNLVRRTVNRKAFSTLPLPVLEFNLINSGMKWGNVLALMTTKLNSIRY